MIIVEGPDGAGKTVLCGLISKKYPKFTAANYGMRREDLHRKDVRGRVYRALAEAIRGTRPMIHDRLFFSELVYGPALRGHSEFKLAEQELIINIISALNVPIILCLPPLAAVKHNMAHAVDENGEPKEHIPGVVDNIGDLYARYIQVAYRLGNSPFLNVNRYDYTAQDPTDLWPTISTYLDERKEREW